MSESLVTVIITCFNEGPYVTGAVQSVLKQTWQHRIGQIIVVDDGSREETKAVVARLSVLDSRVQVIFQENQGLPGARNRALQEATGDYVAILDGDDLWMPEKLELQLPSLEADPSIGLSYTDLYLVEPEQTDERRLVRCISYQPTTKQVLHRFFVNDAPIIPSCAILRRSVFEEVGPFDSNFPFGEDSEMWIRVLARYSCIHITQPSLLKRARLDSLGANELRRMPYYDKITEKSVTANPALAGLVGKRRARRLAKTAQYLEQANRKLEARQHCVQAIKSDPLFARSYGLFFLSLLPTGLSLGVQRFLRRLKHT